jgi:hypothetical protein
MEGNKRYKLKQIVMKFKYLSIVLLGILSTVNAQDGTMPKSNAGIKGGYNLAANYDGSGKLDNVMDSMQGFMENHLSAIVSLQLELLLFTTGI